MLPASLKETCNKQQSYTSNVERFAGLKFAVFAVFKSTTNFSMNICIQGSYNGAV